MADWLVLAIIIILSFDTTLFMQSQISQPLFSCQIVGAVIGNYELGLAVGVFSQMTLMTFVPVGGAKIPDPQIGPNLVLLIFPELEPGIDTIGMLLPVIFATSLIFMYVTQLERGAGTKYMKWVSYERIHLGQMISMAAIWHIIVMTLAIGLIYRIAMELKNGYLMIDWYQPELLFYFTICFALGSMLFRFLRSGISK